MAKHAKESPVDLAAHADAISGTTEHKEPAPAPFPIKNPTISANVPLVSPIAAVRPKKNLSQNRISLAGYLHQTYDVTAERGTELIDIIEPDFWKHVAAKLRPYDTIHVLAEDGSWYARLLVVSADRLWAKVYKLEFHDLTSASKNRPQTQEEEYDVTWTAFGKFAVQKKGNEGLPPLKDGFQTKLEAFTWLDGHLKTLNG